MRVRDHKAVPQRPGYDPHAIPTVRVRDRERASFLPYSRPPQWWSRCGFAIAKPFPTNQVAILTRRPHCLFAIAIAFVFGHIPGLRNSGHDAFSRLPFPIGQVPTLTQRHQCGFAIAIQCLCAQNPDPPRSNHDACSRSRSRSPAHRLRPISPMPSQCVFAIANPFHTFHIPDIPDSGHGAFSLLQCRSQPSGRHPSATPTVRVRDRKSVSLRPHCIHPPQWWRYAFAIAKPVPIRPLWTTRDAHTAGSRSQTRFIPPIFPISFTMLTMWVCDYEAVRGRPGSDICAMHNAGSRSQTREESLQLWTGEESLHPHGCMVVCMGVNDCMHARMHARAWVSVTGKDPWGCA